MVEGYSRDQRLHQNKQWGIPEKRWRDTWFDWFANIWAWMLHWGSRLSSAGASLCGRKAGQKEKESVRVWWEGGREAPAFSLIPSSATRFLFSVIAIFHWDTQREPVLRRQGRAGKIIIRVAMNEVVEAGFSWKRSENAASGPNFQSLLFVISVIMISYVP